MAVALYCCSLLDHPLSRNRINVCIHGLAWDLIAGSIATKRRVVDVGLVDWATGKDCHRIVGWVANARCGQRMLFILVI